jgi:hypothetical protein
VENRGNLGMKIAYTFSSVKNMPKDLLKSVETMNCFVGPEDIIVFYTPPRESEHIEMLENLGVDLRLKEHRSRAFSMGRKDPESYYTDKTWLCTVEDDEVIFLDCDTVVLDDPREILKGEFEFKARPGSFSSEKSDKKWRREFEKRDLPVMDWMPNAGVLAFKNGSHREIEDDWLKHLKYDYDFGEGNRHLEQYALALSVSGKDIQKMTRKEHTYGWENEINSQSIFYHIGGRSEIPPKKAVILNLKSKLEVSVNRLFPLK